MRSAERSSNATETSWRAEQRAERNLLLRALPAAEYAGLLAYLEPAPLQVKQVLYEPNEPIGHAYFPQHGTTSLLALDHAGGAVEVGTIGNEGMVGLPLFHGIHASPHQCFVQIAGEASCITASDFAGQLAEAPTLRSLLLRYTHSVYVDAAQSVACGRLHALEERCARWLLMTDDRVEGSEFVLTQEFLSYMLGTRRPAVSVAMARLQAAGLVRYSRGHVTVLDRTGLEAASCECYRITRAAHEAVFTDTS